MNTRNMNNSCFMYHLIPQNNEHVLCSTILLLVSITGFILHVVRES